MTGITASIKLTRIQAISLDADSERDELDVSEQETTNDTRTFKDRTSGQHDDRRKRDIQRPAQMFSSPLAKFSHHSPHKEVPQVGSLVLGSLLLLRSHLNDSPMNGPPLRIWTNLLTK